MIHPIDMKDDDVWSMFQATRAGDLTNVKALVSRRGDLARCEYNYTPPLHFAVREGHLEIVRFLLEHGADALTYRTYPFLDTLVTMAQDREHHAVARLLLEVLSRQFPVMQGLAGFLDAARRGDLLNIQTELARNSALATACNDTGDTALHQAAAGGHLPAMSALLDAGANADAVRADGLRPAHCALRNHDEERGRALARWLFDRGATYNIYLASLLGDTRFVREALAGDPALSNFEDSSHHRPISAAAQRNDLEMVELLLNHGADPSLPEHGAPLGQALWTAVYRQQPAMARLLLEHGANPNTAPESSGPALLHARHDPDLTRLLIEYGAREESGDLKRLETLIGDNELGEVEKMVSENPDLTRQTPAFWGEGILAGPANNGNREMIELLIRFGASVPEVTKWGPEYYFKHTDIAALLLERGMNPNHRNWHDFTLLHHMAAKGFLPKARLLLDHGAAIDAVDEEYRSTPLGCAARWGQRVMVAFLIERGADSNKAGAPWATPLAWARKKGHFEIEADLRRSGAQ